MSIEVEKIGKQYTIGERISYKTLRDRLSSVVLKPIHWLIGSHRKRKVKNSTIWALKDITFTVEHGEVMGIIGRNGAGKSTLLKVLSRITRPTKGYAQVWGRVGSLLEVGTGFHPELTGRENIFLNGAILGMGKQEIVRKFDQIVEFAEITTFLDTPVKFYSSGMFVRLAFAVAAHLDPEILLIDEVLAVGDAAFQQKCLKRMDHVAKEGRTILFVSNNMHAVKKLCHRVVWLDDGKIVEIGDTAEVVNHYLSKVSTTQMEQRWDDMASAPGNDKVRLHGARIVPADPEQGQLTVWSSFALEFYYWNLIPDAKLNLSLILYNSENVMIFNSTTTFEKSWHDKPFPNGLFKSVCQIPSRLLNDGFYYIDLMVVKDTSTPVFRFESVLSFELMEEARARPGKWYGKYQGIVRPFLEWQTEFLGE